jgi:hypothetical protein
MPTLHSVLSDFNEDNFNRASNIIRHGTFPSPSPNNPTQQTLPTLPVIQGNADVGKCLNKNKLQKAITFCRGILHPVDPEHACVALHLNSKLLDLNGPIVTPEEIELLMLDNIEVQLMLKKINVHKGTRSAFTAIGSFSDEVTAGYLVRVHRGNIGLVSHHVPKKGMLLNVVTGETMGSEILLI